jgi:hypothetical protein
MHIFSSFEVIGVTHCLVIRNSPRMKGRHGARATRRIAALVSLA